MGSNGKTDITRTRRISQALFFLLLVYGGFLYLPMVNTDALPFVESKTNVTKIESLDAPQGYTEVFDTYTPFRTCRYVDGNRIFRACSVHYLTEVPVYGVPWYDFIPHFFFIVLLSFLLGRFFCGWVCPLGAFSDFMGIIRKKTGLERLKIPKRFSNAIKTLKSVWVAVLFMFAVAIAIPFLGLAAFQKELFLISCQTCPARIIFPAISGNVPGWFPFDNPISAAVSVIGIIFLTLLLLGFFGKRLWCRFCPNGMMMSWFNKGCLMTKEKDVKKCTRCGTCKRVCPMDNEEVYSEKTKKDISSQNCIMCFTCIDKCPENDCLKAKLAGRRLFSSKYGDGYNDTKAKV